MTRLADFEAAAVDDCLPGDLAERLRSDIEAYFRHPRLFDQEHQIWSYWCEPGHTTYYYMRTEPQNIHARQNVGALMTRVSEAIAQQLDVAPEEVGCTWPVLSMYLPGMRQGWHNDAGTGFDVGWVYSLSRGLHAGGQTLVWRGHGRSDAAMAGPAFHHELEPRFNRLVLFAATMPHSVRSPEGTMDPLHARFVMQGLASIRH